MSYGCDPLSPAEVANRLGIGGDLLGFDDAAVLALNPAGDGIAVDLECGSVTILHFVLDDALLSDRQRGVLAGQDFDFGSGYGHLRRLGSLARMRRRLAAARMALRVP